MLHPRGTFNLGDGMKTDKWAKAREAKKKRFSPKTKTGKTAFEKRIEGYKREKMKKRKSLGTGKFVDTPSYYD